MAYVGTAVAVLGLMFAMLKYFEGRIDKKFDRVYEKFDRVDEKFDRVDAKLEAMNQRIFDLALALRPHIRQVQEDRARV